MQILNVFVITPGFVQNEVQTKYMIDQKVTLTHENEMREILTLLGKSSTQKSIVAINQLV
jgi:hypothetical protein